jgi:hypothetical protein
MGMALPYSTAVAPVFTEARDERGTEEATDA